MNPVHNPDMNAKVFVAGDFAVGKTNLLVRYCQGIFFGQNPRIFEQQRRVETIQGRRIRLVFWDTVEQERYKTVTTSLYKGCHGIIFCYAVNNRESFERLEYWMDQVLQQGFGDACKILVATKSDLADHIVTADEGRRKAVEWGVEFFETSAQHDLNVTEAIEELARQIKERYLDGQVGKTANKNIACIHHNDNNNQKCSCKTSLELKKDKPSLPSMNPKEANSPDIVAKIVIVSASGVGKTSLLIRFCQGTFLNLQTAIGVDFHQKTIKSFKRAIRFEFWDLADQERYTTVSPSLYKGCQGIIFCYAVNNRESFERLDYWMGQVNQQGGGEDPCKILVATKSDLADHIVTADEGRRKATEWGVEFFETSAQDDLNVTEAIEELARQIKERHLDTKAGKTIKNNIVSKNSKKQESSDRGGFFSFFKS